MEDAPKVLGHAFILKWVVGVGATMVKLAQANKTTRHTYIMMVVRVCPKRVGCFGYSTDFLKRKASKK